MRWRFTLIKRDSTEKVIDEPVGWDATEIVVRRDRDTHGVFFDYQGNDFEFHDTARAEIKAEYEEWGVEGKMELKIEECCDAVTDFEELYRGRLLFSRYEEVCGANCYVKIPVETTGDTMKFRNRWDQKVDLLANKAFDGTVLPAYAGLPMEIMLPSKGIYLRNRAVYNFDNPAFAPSLANVPNVVGTTGSNQHINFAWVNIVPQFDKIELSEIGRFSTPADVEHHILASGLNSTNPAPAIHKVVQGTGTNQPETRTVLFDWLVNTPIVVNEGGGNNFDAVPKFDLSVSFAQQITQKNAAFYALYVIVVIVRKDGTHVYLDKTKIFNINFTVNSPFGVPPSAPQVVNYSKQFQGVTMRDGDHLFVCMPAQITYSVRLQGGIWQAPDLPAYELKTLSGTIEMSALSKTPKTPCSLFLMNESISRVAEAISDGEIKGYSQYYGRTDSQPYAHNEDGCSSLKAITRGLFIRGQEARNGPASMPISLKEIWEGADPIDHIGFGLEKDTFRPGFQRLRVEPWYYFYPKRLLLACKAVAEVRNRVVDNEHYSTFSFGYQKWEAEEFNGLDEFLTKRIYRTSLAQVKNELPKLSKFVASGYAWEITRRKRGSDSKDWRFDNETFVVCLERQTYDEFGPYLASIGGNKLTLLTTTQAPAWAIVGTVVELIVTDANGVSIPVNNGNYTITGQSAVGGGIQLLVAPNFLSSMLFALVTVRSHGVNRLGVELGKVSNPQNIIDPPTIYNFRISPLRNALRWISELFAGYRKISANNKLLFTDGDGNYHASGSLDSTFCKWEAGDLSEKTDVDITMFADPAKAAPVLRPERDLFDYPMSVRDFKKILADPYGVIYYESECRPRIGWIDEIRYKPEDGTASFQLIPAYTISADDLELREGLATEGLDIIENENDQNILTE